MNKKEVLLYILDLADIPLEVYINDVQAHCSVDSFVSEIIRLRETDWEDKERRGKERMTSLLQEVQLKKLLYNEGNEVIEE